MPAGVLSPFLLRAVRADPARLYNVKMMERYARRAGSLIALTATRITVVGPRFSLSSGWADTMTVRGRIGAALLISGMIVSQWNSAPRPAAALAPE